MPATSSQSRMISPPCTFPALFASAIPIQRLRIELDDDGGRGSTRARRLLLARPNTRLKEGRHAWACGTDVHSGEGEDLEDARQDRGPRGDARLRLPEADGAASEREEGHRRRRHVEEAPSDAVVEARAAGGEARHAGAAGALAGTGGPRPHGARAEEPGANGASVARPAGEGAREPAGAADRERAAAPPEDRAVPDEEGGH